MAALVIPVGGIDLAGTLGALAALPGDPTVHLEPGSFARSTWTPDGPATVQATWSAGAASPGDSTATAQVRAFGDGAAWLRARAPALLGCADDVSGFDPASPDLRAAWRRHRRDRIPRTGTLWHDLACFIVQQRINGKDAAAQWGRFVLGLGQPAPGDLGLTLPPAAERVAALAYHDLHRFGIERQRADHLRAAARAVLRLPADLVDGPASAAESALRGVRGIGAWTAGCLAAQTWGERDTVILGDYGIPAAVAWLLAGERRADDTRLVELLAPYRPHRYRVIRLAHARHSGPPRRTPRGARTDIRTY